MSWYCWPAIMLINATLPFRYALRGVHNMILRRRSSSMPPMQPPIFVIGHWRSGTSLLHELMTLDPRHSAPTMYECFYPLHFLVTEPLVLRLAALRPKKARPMDDMKIGMDSPQEDEFALFFKGAPTPYETLCFPNEPCPNPKMLDVRKLPPADLAEWKAALSGFIQEVYCATGRRLVLKSPTHTARVEVLAEMFPGARFVYITRHPYDLLSSNRKLFRSLGPVCTLEKFDNRDIDANIFENYRLNHERVEAGRKALPAGQFYDLRFEDLVRAPQQEMQKLYEQLGLGDFEAVRPRIDKYFADRKAHKVGNYKLSPSDTTAIQKNWGHILRQYGYE